ncbi:hydroxyacid dehydrogenase [Petroclostridium sp. X23]|uniref:hydroxyacid dehydrogenase n=1 Tax=Petroclostridium sp. X23 TaxID=3045146 RepID=UPI0024ACC9CF|nr:hydroxyacid dehydrogenase [Petroclostridium sp. X23]WHH59915.1 hydroxyacid dehydrogenase [Petroclostridium sp. X23]
MKKILLTQEIHPLGRKLLQENFEVIASPDPSHETVLGLCDDVDAIIVRTTTTITEEIIKRAQKLKIIARTGAGVDNIDVNAATRAGILVCNLVGVNSLSVCEHAISMMMTIAKQLPLMDISVREGNWKMRNVNTMVELKDKTLGIIGMGNIGAEVARKCHLAFDMKIMAYDPYAKEKFMDFDYEFLDSLEELFESSDFISIHCPNLPSTTGMVTSNLLNLMKSDAYLINTARGAVIDEEALVELLRNKKIAGAALDVFYEEPLPIDHPFIHLDNVILSPHSAALTKEARIRMSTDAAQAVVDYFDGKNPKNIYNAKELGLK